MAGRRTILMVEDETSITEPLAEALDREGFDTRVAGSVADAIEQATEELPDLVLLDVELPDGSGYDVARTLRESSKVPIIMLTARGEETDRIVGLELGADDYIAKPFSPRELVLRVKAVLRRGSENGTPASVLETGGIALDVAAHSLTVRGKDVPLTATEFRLLHLLMDRRGRVQTRGKLLSDAWGYAEDVDSRTVDTHVRRLRRKLGPEAQRLETVIGVGYRLKP